MQNLKRDEKHIREKTEHGQMFSAKHMERVGVSASPEDRLKPFHFVRPVELSAQVPGRLRVGDINSDGFPDIIASFQNSPGALSIVFLNQHCDGH
jgi:hypothetical protein